MISTRQGSDGATCGASSRTSAERRLGRPLLLIYLGLGLFGLAVIAASVIVMHL
jgi:hypothetical protein